MTARLRTAASCFRIPSISAMTSSHVAGRFAGFFRIMLSMSALTVVDTSWLCRTTGTGSPFTVRRKISLVRFASNATFPVRSS